MNYQKEAELTESPQFHSELIRMRSFESSVAQAIQSLRRLDKIKKTLFYGKTDHNIGPIPKALTVAKVLTAFKYKDGNSADTQSAIRIIHGIFGVATEACEMLELLFKVVSEDKPFDAVNLSEECGDVLWYIACCLNATGMSFEQVQIQNIAKLRARFPNKFTEFDAINRDLGNERAILENKVVERVEDLMQTLDDVADGKTSEETAAGMLNRLGVDGDAWAREFINSAAKLPDSLEPHLDFVRSWFAAAIERARDEQRWQMERENLALTSLRELAGFLTAKMPILHNTHPEAIFLAMQEYITVSDKPIVAEKPQQLQDGVEA